MKATEIASEVKPPQTVGEAVAAARDVLISKGQIFPKEFVRAKEVAKGLVRHAEERLQALSARLHAEIGVVRPGFQFAASTGSGEFPQVTNVAKQLVYSANLKEFNQWAQLGLKTEQVSGIVVSFHGVGAKFQGVLVVSVFLHQDGLEPIPATDSVFQINYEETAEQADKRFTPWLESSLTNALNTWRRNL